MKTRLYFFAVIVLTVSLTALWRFEHSKITLPTPSVTANVTNAAPPAHKGISISQGSGADGSSEIASNNLVAKYKEYQQGKINEGEVMQAIVLGKNRQNQDLYGKVIDQYGKPIADAIVSGNIMLDAGPTASKEEMHTTQSDSAGLFQFTGLRGASLGITARKQGYEIGERGEGYQAPVSGKSNPTDRVILTMWKLRGAEPMRHISTEARIPFDGTSVVFDLVTGKENPNGDLQITLLRSPLNVRRSGQKFDWSVKIEMLRGGIMAEDVPYPYWAPESGYQPYFQFNISSNDVPWDSTTTQNFYIRNSQGQFGRMLVKPYASVTPAGISFDLWLNPSGSQNLEFDPAKQVQ
jgi:hypothetical protein